MPLDAATLQLHVHSSTALPLDKKKAHREMSNSFCRVKHTTGRCCKQALGNSRLVTHQSGSKPMTHMTECHNMEMAVKPSDPCPQVADEKVQLSSGHLPRRCPEAVDVSL